MQNISRYLDSAKFGWESRKSRVSDEISLAEPGNAEVPQNEK